MKIWRKQPNLTAKEIFAKFPKGLQERAKQTYKYNYK
jgi:hypothetical protein